jgi:myo-inositol-1(or 4)-monophosphatase
VVAPEELDLARALAVAREAAGAGVDTLREAWERRGRATIVADEKQPRDLVTEADRAAERCIVERIRAAFPDHALLAEESDHGESREGLGAARWVVDPLDGTANFVHGIPMWAVSVALLDGDAPVVGVVVDPVRDEWFTAVTGRGAFLDGGDPADAEPLAVSPSREPGRAILATGFPFRRPVEIDRYLEAFGEIFRRVSDMRRAGSAALDLAYVASGRLEGFWEIGLHRWDIAAGELLVLEAGGRVSDWRGGDEHRTTGWIAAGNPTAHDLLIEVLAAYAPTAEGV